MPKKKQMEACNCMCCQHKGHKMFGLGLVLFGLIVYLGYHWSLALMLIGVLMLLKGLVK